MQKPLYVSEDFVKNMEELVKSQPEHNQQNDILLGNLKREHDIKGFEDQPELIETADKMGITPRKLVALRKYVALLIKDNRKIKQSTIRKRVFEKFNIKIQ